MAVVFELLFTMQLACQKRSGSEGTAEGLLQLLGKGCGVVDQDGAVGAAGGEAVAVGTEGDAVVSAAMPSEGEEFLAGLAVPQLDRRIGRCASQTLIVGAEGDCIHTREVTEDRVEL